MNKGLTSVIILLTEESDHAPERSGGALKCAPLSATSDIFHNTIGDIAEERSRLHANDTVEISESILAPNYRIHILNTQ